VAVAACEQCGGNRVPRVHPVQDLSAWLSATSHTTHTTPARCVLSLAEGSQPLGAWMDRWPADQAVAFLSGPEGGLSAQEDQAARAAGWQPVSLGERVLRAETAALAALVRALA
jgi:16S rRNA (uracil1498-N3)-methyltransferase